MREQTFRDVGKVWVSAFRNPGLQEGRIETDVGVHTHRLRSPVGSRTHSFQMSKRTFIPLARPSPRVALHWETT
jgi:hypothetical protein